MSRMDESVETDSRLMAVSVWGKRNGEVCRVSLLGDGNILELETVVVA